MDTLEWMEVTKSIEDVRKAIETLHNAGLSNEEIEDITSEIFENMCKEYNKE